MKHEGVILCRRCFQYVPIKTVADHVDWHASSLAGQTVPTRAARLILHRRSFMSQPPSWGV